MGRGTTTEIHHFACLRCVVRKLGYRKLPSPVALRLISLYRRGEAYISLDWGVATTAILGSRITQSQIISDTSYSC